MRGRHNRFAGFRVPSMQGPDVEAGGGGGGGTAPTAPSDVTTPTPATKWVTWGGYNHAVMAAGNYATWKSWGFAGHLGGLAGTGYFAGFGGSQTMIGSTAAALGSSYDWQKAYQGLAVSGINGTNTNLGVFRAKAADSSIIAGLVVRIASQTNPITGSIGDIFNSTVRAAFCTEAKLWAQGINYLGGNALGIDLEYGYWGSISGHTDAATLTQYEALGYEFGTAFWGTSGVPSIDLYVYDWQADGAWHLTASSGGTYSPMPSAVYVYQTRTQFMYGVMRAHATLNATGRIRFIDAFFYRGTQLAGASLQTALKWNCMGRTAAISRGVAASTWSQVAPYFDVTPFSWAGTDGTAYYNSTQETQPTYTDRLEQYRRYGMGGYRAEFTLSVGTPGRSATEGGSGLWAGGNDYLTPSGRIAAMVTATSSSTSYSTTAPTLSASASGSGSTRTISGTCSHELGVSRVKAYLYPSGTPVYAQMTFNLAGGTPTTNINNAYQDYTLTLTGVASGNYAIVTGYSIQNQEKSTVVGPF